MNKSELAIVMHNWRITCVEPMAWKQRPHATVLDYAFSFYLLLTFNRAMWKTQMHALPKWWSLKRPSTKTGLTLQVLYNASQKLQLLLCVSLTASFTAQCRLCDKETTSRLLNSIYKISFTHQRWFLNSNDAFEILTAIALLLLRV